MIMIYERTRQIVAEWLDVPITEVTANTHFQEELAESLEFAEMIMACEEEFGVTIPDEDAARLDTVGQLSAYIINERQPEGSVWPPPPNPVS